MSAKLLFTRRAPITPLRPTYTPLLDFLAPSIVTSRRLQTTSASPSSPPTPTNTSPTTTTSPENSSSQNAVPKNAAPLPPLTPAQSAFLDSALRVNQAGELAAVLIYSSQNPLLIKSHPHLRPLLKHMHDQEAGHFAFFNSYIAKHRIRPTALYPVWTLAATALGWGTALMGREAAMACTEAVETEIGGHYNEQVRVLLDWVEKLEARGEGVGEELGGLVKTLRRIRDEELEHLDHAVENDAKEAKPYELLTEVIRGGCRGAIWVSERV